MASNLVQSACLLALVLFAAPALAINDTDILNFALNLEYLEASFYSCAAWGVPLNASLTATKAGGKAGNVTGCVKALLSPEAYGYAASIAADEIAHVVFLRNAISAAKAVPISLPNLNLGTAFGGAANAAVGATLEPPFSPYGDDLNFYLGAYIFEDVGATAYHGALGLFANPAYIAPAAGILGTEAYHAGAVRTKLYDLVSTYVYPYGATTGQVVAAISGLRDKAAGTHIDVGLYNAKGALALVPGDTNAIIYARTTTQVLDIVYLGGTGSGGFFPSGLNGLIR